MMWAFASRQGDIMNLAVRDIILGIMNADGTVPVSLTIRRGKGARFRGPYQLGSLMTQQGASTLHALMCRKVLEQYLFSDATLVKNAVRYALRQQNPLSALPSLRKGAALHLAAMNVPQSQIMLMTGHTRLNTLHRYLGYGHHLTTEGAGQRRSCPPPQPHELGCKAPDAINLGVNEVELYNLIRQMNNEVPITLPHPST